MAWDSNTLAVYRFENNGNDDIGVYNATNFGTPLYDNTIFYDGAYSLKKTDYAANFLLSPASLNTYLTSTTNVMTFEGQVYAVNGFPIVFCRRSDTNVGNPNFIWVYFNISAQRISFRWGGTEYLLNNFSSGTDLNRWMQWAVTYDRANTTVKFYKDNQLIYTNTSAPDPFAVSAATIEQGGCGIGSGASLYYCDQHIMSKVLRTSFPTVELPSGAKSIGTYGLPKKRFKRTRIGAI